MSDKNTVSTVDPKYGPLTAGSLTEMADILANNRD